MDSDIDSPQIGTIIKDLQGQVDEYAKYDGKEQSKESSLSFNAGSKYLYMGIPIGIFILLAFMQPAFIKYEKYNDDGTSTYHLSFQKLLMWTLILGVLSNIGVFAYNYKKAK
jgi:hypothetical protein